MIGQTISHYKILEKLGEGGMGVGEHDDAIDQLEYLLTIPSLISVPRLKFQPVWEPLHQHPRFKRLLEKYGGKP